MNELATRSKVRGKLTPGAPLAPLVWFKSGGAAEWLFEPKDENDLVDFLRELDPDVPVMALGLGSNMIVRDGGVPGVVIRLGKRSLGVLPDVLYPGELDRLVRAAGLETWRRRSVGFGPFTLLGVRLLSEARSVALHRRLQRLADRGVPLLRAAGMNSMVLATKPR